jgi:hypothetical protein
MSNSTTTINASEVGVKPQEIKPYPDGAHDTYTAGTVTAQNNTDTQMALIKASGGSRKKIKRNQIKQTKRRNGGWIKPKRGGSSSKSKSKSKQRTKRRNGGWIKPKRGGSKSKSKHKRVRFSKQLIAKKTKSGGSGVQHVIVPNIHVPYTETGVEPQTVNGVHSQNVHNASVSHTNSVYDDCVGKTPEQCQISNNDSAK